MWYKLRKSSDDWRGGGYASSAFAPQRSGAKHRARAPRCIAFYSKLFGVEPAKVKPGYANFAIANPPLKLVLMENSEPGGSINHLGVEVENTEEVERWEAKLAT